MRIVALGDQPTAESSSVTSVGASFFLKHFEIEWDPERNFSPYYQKNVGLGGVHFSRNTDLNGKSWQVSLC